MKILCIGHAAYDITIPVEHFPSENTKNRVSSKIECSGGPASNAAYLLGKWGMDVSFIGCVGDDLYGEKIRTSLEQAGVNTKYLTKISGEETTSSFIIANLENGSRTIYTYRPNQLVSPYQPLDDVPDIILTDGQEVEYTKKIIEAYPKAVRIIDAGRATPEIIELCKSMHFVICSRDFALQLSQKKLDETPESYCELLRTLQSILHTNVVITLEERGCLYEYQHQIKIMPSLKVKAKDSTAAGDIFHGAFTYAYANHYPFEEALKIATIAGAISVTKIGGTNSMPTKEEMKKYYADFR